MENFFRELRRRNVVRVAGMYLVAGWVLVQIASTLEDAMNLPDWFDGIVVALLIIGLPIALLLAWAFELTPEGVVRTENVPEDKSITSDTGRKLDYAIIAGIIILGGVILLKDTDKTAAVPELVVTEAQTEKIAVEPTAQDPGEAPADSPKAEAATPLDKSIAVLADRSGAVTTAEDNRSIAVLAFDDMSPEGDQEYMSDGIAEELLNLLAKIPELRVVSRSTAFSYKGKDLDLPEIARQLNVAHILEGSVRKSGNRIRITAQLIDARSDTHLWSETYDREMDDIFAIQDEVAAIVVDELKIKLTGKALKVREANPLAYDLYLKAAYQIGWVATEASHREAIELLEQALEIDEDYVSALDLLSIAYLNSVLGQYDFIPREEAITKSREAILRSYELDPTGPMVLVLLGVLKYEYENDLHGAAEYTSRALELAPDDWRILEGGQHVLMTLGRYEEAIKVQEYILKVEPLNLINQENMLLAYRTAGHYPEALAMIEARLTLEPDSKPDLAILSILKSKLRDAEGALEHLSNVPHPGERLRIETIAYHDLGKTQDFETSLAKTLEYAKDNPDFAFGIAELYSVLGDADEMFAWLERAYEYGNLHLMYSNPDFKDYYDDPRWIDLLNRLGTSKETLDAIKFEVKIPNQ